MCMNYVLFITCYLSRLLVDFIFIATIVIALIKQVWSVIHYQLQLGEL